MININVISENIGWKDILKTQIHILKGLKKFNKKLKFLKKKFVYNIVNRR